MSEFFFKLSDKYHHLTEQVVRFMIVGVTNTGADFIIYYALTRGFRWWRHHFLLANAIAFIVAVAVSFMLNNFWTFKRDAEGWHARSLKFLAVNVAALALNSAMLFALTTFGMHDLFAKILASVTVGFWNFTLYKLWAFRA